MKTVAHIQDVEPEKLKPVLHCKIEQMRPDQLTLLHKVMLQLEAEELADHLSEAFDQDEQQGKLHRIPELIRQFRTIHPYR